MQTKMTPLDPLTTTTTTTQPPNQRQDVERSRATSKNGDGYHQGRSKKKESGGL